MMQRHKCEWCGGILPENPKDRIKTILGEFVCNEKCRKNLEKYDPQDYGACDLHSRTLKQTTLLLEDAGQNPWNEGFWDNKVKAIEEL